MPGCQTLLIQTFYIVWSVISHQIAITCKHNFNDIEEVAKNNTSIKKGNHSKKLQA